MRFFRILHHQAAPAGEVDGLHYFFKTREEFEQMVKEGAFLEHMQVFGQHFYGTPRAYVEQQRAAGQDILLDIDVHGAMNVKKACPDAVLVFLAPPSMSCLKSGWWAGARKPPRRSNSASRNPSRKCSTCRIMII